MRRIEIAQKFCSEIDKLGIKIIYLYGSEATGSAHFDSDIDIGIVLDNPEALSDQVKRANFYHVIRKLLYEAIDPNYDRELDVVFLERASYSLQNEAIKYGRVLYESSKAFRAEYEAKVLLRYLDLKPLLNHFYNAALERIK